MTDRRELILARMFTLLETVSGTGKTVRNRGQLEDVYRPGIVMLDGDEDPENQVTGRGRPPNAPQIMAMTPEIYILLENAEPGDTTRGADLNDWRVRIMTALLFDTQLQTLITSNGELRYMGCLTDYATGRAMEGAMRLNFTVTYPFKPSEL